MSTIAASVVNVLFLTQEVDTNIKVLAVEHDLGIADAVVQNMLPQGPRSLLHLQDSATFRRTFSMSVSNVLTLSEFTLPRSEDRSVSDLLFIWQDVIVEDQWPDVRQSLTLTQEAVADLSSFASDTLTLTQEVSVSMSITVPASSTLNLVDGGNGYLPSVYWISFPINIVEP